MPGKSALSPPPGLMLALAGTCGFWEQNRLLEDYLVAHLYMFTFGFPGWAHARGKDVTSPVPANIQAPRQKEANFELVVSMLYFAKRRHLKSTLGPMATSRQRRFGSVTVYLSESQTYQRSLPKTITISPSSIKNSGQKPPGTCPKTPRRRWEVCTSAQTGFLKMPPPPTRQQKAQRKGKQTFSKPQSEEPLDLDHLDSRCLQMSRFWGCISGLWDQGVYPHFCDTRQSPPLPAGLVFGAGPFCTCPGCRAFHESRNPPPRPGGGGVRLEKLLGAWPRSQRRGAEVQRLQQLLPPVREAPRLAERNTAPRVTAFLNMWRKSP